MTPEQMLVKQNHLDQMFHQLDQIQEKASVQAVFGQPVKVGERLVIPIAQVSYGYGLGFGEGGASQTPEENADSGAAGGAGAGGGGGAAARPLAMAEITPEGVHIEPVINEQAVVMAGIALAAWSIFWIARAVIKIFGRSR